ncbi:MAG: GNAT family N-acetyltransferase [Clostridium argentinense]|uniref:GNAT family N-acetyltransferase n=1 Tax=uncultured Clostridium sp. TaxID=59620 RepID=UPI001D860E2F|nr:GNAT family N-acetyltransferase [uncultured Clostridium sp.]MBS5822728.1 GNAT family N-acetyltransferase [Clostridium argentinense]MDU1348469.1 GNAT family N-acetyltransferase [Clostridium argentinense]
MLNIRRAKVDEYEILTDIAIKSEGYWGYDSDYMDKFKSIYNVSEEFIKNNPTVLIEEDNSVIGFYGLICKDNGTSLEYFFIEPKYIGKGYGKLLWNYLVNHCKNLGIEAFEIVTSLQAKEFYVKMGAIPCGEVESLLKKGRIIPQLIYRVEK